MKHVKSDLEYLAEQQPGCPLYPEEKLVDYAMNRLSRLESVLLERHLNECARCAGAAAEWMTLLGGSVVDTANDVLFDGASNREAESNKGSAENYVYRDRAPIYEAWEDRAGYPNTPAGQEPSPRLRRKLMHAAYLRAIVSRIRVKPYVVWQVLAGGLLIMLVIGLFSLKNGLGQEEATIEHTVNQRIAHMQSEDTERYVIQPIEPFYGSGSVWLKRASGEMLIVVNGLHSLEEKDYQVWLQNGGQLSSAGFMLVPGTQARGYYYGYVTKDAERIVVSMEPKGGSLKPTGPEAVLVDMGR